MNSTARSSWRSVWFFWGGTGLAATAATLLLFRGHLGHLGHRFIGNHNDILYAFNTMQWNWHALLELRPWTLMDAPVMYPLPHGTAYGDSLLCQSLLGLPIAALGREVLAYNLVLLGTYVLCALFMAGFAHCLTGSRAVAMVAGLAFAFFPMRLTNVYHFNNLAFMWVPLCLWAVVRWHRSRSPRWLGIMGLGLLAQLFSSIQLSLHLGLFVGLLMLGLWARAGFRIQRRELLQLLALVSALALACLPWALVYAEVREFVPMVRSVDRMFGYRIRPADLFVGVVRPGSFVLFFLLVAMLLAGLRAVPRWRQATWLQLPRSPPLLGLLVIVFVGGVLALGPYTKLDGDIVPLPYYWLLKIYPIMWSIRVPHRLQRVLMAFATGAAAIALAWTLTLASRAVAVGVERLRRPWGALGEQATRALCVTLAVVWILVSAEPVSPRSMALPRLSVTPALRGLEQGAVVIPYPFFLNWPTRPPIDQAGLDAGITLVGGYGAAISMLFWQLRRRVDVFPSPRALAAMDAVGATHVLVNRRQLRGFQARGLDALVTSGRLWRSYRDHGWDLYQLGGDGARSFELASQPSHALTLLGPTRAAPGQRVTFALIVEISKTAIDTKATALVSARVVKGAKETMWEGTVAVSSPRVVEPDGHPYMFAVTVPQVPGAYTLEVARHDQTLSWPFEVSAELGSTWNRSPGLAHIEVVTAPPHVLHGLHFPLTLKIENGSDTVWMATSDCDLPERKGAVVFRARFAGPRSRASPRGPRGGYLAIPHDLAPGDSATVTLFFKAPSTAGEFHLVLTPLTQHVRGPAEESVRLPEPFVVE